MTDRSRRQRDRITAAAVTAMDGASGTFVTVMLSTCESLRLGLPLSVAVTTSW